MHAGGFDAAHHLDRAREFAFERPDAGHFLHEGRQAEGAKFVVELVAGVGLFGKPFSASIIRARAVSP